MAVKIVKPRALPYAECVGISSSRTRDGSYVGFNIFSIMQLSCNLIVGLNACEREDKQVVHFDVDFARQTSANDEAFDFRGLGKYLRQITEESAFISLESLASLVAQTTLRRAARETDIVTVRAAKSKALVFADAAEVEMVRSLRDYPTIAKTKSSPLGLASLLSSITNAKVSSPTELHSATIAFGTNLGDRFANIEAALRLLEVPERFIAGHDIFQPRITVVNTSFLYETSPMYVTDQPKFMNGACIVATNLPPRTLLEVLKAVETTVGRVPTIRNGPRPVDLDIVLYDDAIIDTRPEADRANLDNLEGHLVVPHPRMTEREFVLRPLNDMTPHYIHPLLKKPIHFLLSEVVSVTPADTPAMNKVVPFPRYPHSLALDPPVKAVPEIPSTREYWSFPPLHAPHNQKASSRRTRIMATLNVTPDSFSDGSVNNSLDAALQYATHSVSAGAEIIDIGGYSTRPGATYVTPEEEISRVVPIVQHLRSTNSSPLKDVLISVDTFRPDVARAAVLAGANCINDVYAFTGPEYPLTRASAEHFIEMRRVARELAVPVVLMHSRGDAGANKDYSRYNDSSSKAVLDGVTLELGEKVDLIVGGPGGVRRWLVMVDPGIGFSKTLEGNLEILRSAATITADTMPPTITGGQSSQALNSLRGYPQLIGASRKSFLGAILAQPDASGTYAGRSTEPKERGWATAAAVTSAVQQGAAVVRVHDTLELGDVVRVANALWS
ncbi:Dihydropteroate synthase [Artomyces pyxidatus]|uniref:Dihydropteroate synthase n=1 Tax=Artomyces pyxidatus TaxID=48021 RepID=A0ACB8SU96_9AGAM|nr:Dihydropteroate synthase [Artomyces pyxidatus]